MEDVTPSSDENKRRIARPRKAARKAQTQPKEAEDKRPVNDDKTGATETEISAKHAVAPDKVSDNAPPVPSAVAPLQEKPFTPNPNLTDKDPRLVPIDAWNAAPEDTEFGRKKAHKGDDVTPLLSVLCYDARTGAKRELHFGKIPFAEIDSTKKAHIDAINQWRTQIWSRAGYKMKHVNLFHEIEDDWLELFVDVSIAQGLKKPVKFAGTTYVAAQFNEFFEGKVLKDADGKASAPRCHRENSAFSSKIGRVNKDIRDSDIQFKNVFDKEAREFKPKVTGRMLEEFREEKMKLLGGTREAYVGNKKNKRIVKSICKALVDFCAKFLDENMPSDSINNHETTVASETSARGPAQPEISPLATPTVASHPLFSDANKHANDEATDAQSQDRGGPPKNDAGERKTAEQSEQHVWVGGPNKDVSNGVISEQSYVEITSQPDSNVIEGHGLGTSTVKVGLEAGGPHCPQH
jgi:hypothetical protein